MSDLSPLEGRETVAGGILAVLTGAWAIVRRRDSLRPLKLAIAEIRTEQGVQAASLAELKVSCITRDEFSKAIDKLFEKMDRNREHSDDQFQDLSRRVDRVIDRRPS